MFHTIYQSSLLSLEPKEISDNLETVSSIAGWIAFFVWSASFYPQIILNYRRKSVVGLSLDYLVLNIVGFACLAVFVLPSYYSDTIRDQFDKRHPSQNDNMVERNDVFFALHSLVLTLFTYYQTLIYDRGDQKVRKLVKLFVVGVLIMAGVLFGAVNYKLIEWLDFIYIASFVKLIVTLIKYIPQALLNARRKSTQGWSIANVLMDFTGGVLSLGQLFLNAILDGNISQAFTNPVKVGMGLFSIGFDLLFMGQHYLFYPRQSYEEVIVDYSNLEEGKRIPSKPIRIPSDSDSDTDTIVNSLEDAPLLSSRPLRYGTA